MDNVSIAWAAGLFDGEGCLSICIYQPYSLRPDIQMKMAMNNTDERTVSRFQEIVRTGSYNLTLTAANDNRKNYYQWRCSSTIAVGTTELLLPYLVTKRERAELFLEFYSKWNRKHGHTIEQPHMPELLAIWQEMRELNKRGK